MLVLLASCFDAQARGTVAGWPGEARVLTPRDLSRQGWRHRPGAVDNAAVIDGLPAATDEIEGVITRLPAVLESDLGPIAATDRTYVAAEMTAWLAAWLSELPCPVLNRPSPIHLMGPPWSREQWLLAARRLGLPIVPAHRSTHADRDGYPAADPLQASAVTVTVIGRKAVGGACRVLADAAAALAEVAGVELLRAQFASPEDSAPFITADYWVNIEQAAVRVALLERLTETAP